MPKAVKTAMTEADRMFIEHACAGLMTDYARFTDEGSAESLAGLTAKGSTAFKKVTASTPGSDRIASMSILSNVRVRAASETAAAGSAYQAIYMASRKDPDEPARMQIAAPHAMGVITCGFAKSKSGWRITSWDFAPVITGAPIN